MIKVPWRSSNNGRSFKPAEPETDIVNEPDPPEEELEESTDSAPQQSQISLMGMSPPKICPRCRGTMILEEDWYGSYSNCLQCGYVYEFGAVVEELSDDGDENPEPQRQRRRSPSHGKIRL